MSDLLTDTLYFTGAALLFPLILVIPGYLVGTMTNALTFRDLEIWSVWRTSVLISMAITPITFYLIGKYGGINWILIVVAVGFIALILLLITRQRAILTATLTAIRQLTPISIVIASGGYLLFMAMLVDISVGDDVIRRLMDHDYVKHVAVTDTITRTGIVPVNPSYYPGEPYPLFYYYFWFILCSIVDVLGGSFIDARAAVMGGVLWGGIVLLCVIVEFAHRWGESVVVGFNRSHVRLLLLLMLVTGLDLLPVLSGGIAYWLFDAGSPMPPTIEWWNDQVPAWLGAIFWVSHHVASFCACMVAFIALDEWVMRETFMDRYLASGIAALALASAAGMSIWVAIVGGSVLFIWFVINLWHRQYRECVGLILIGVFALLLVSPYISDLAGTNQDGRFPLAVSVRAFPLFDSFAEEFSDVYRQFVRLILLPLNYILELGFYAVGALVYWGIRRNIPIPLNRRERFMLTMTLVALVICSFVKSALFNNDFGWRGFMFVQFSLLFYSVPLLISMQRRVGKIDYNILPLSRRMGLVFAFIGFLGTAFDMVSSRIRFLKESDIPGGLLKDAYSWIDKNSTSDAIIQHNPALSISYFDALYGHRQVVLADRVYGRLYGVSALQYSQLNKSIEPLFSKETTVQSAMVIIDKYQIDYLVVKSEDVIWDTDSTWLHLIKPSFQNSGCKIFRLDLIEIGNKL